MVKFSREQKKELKLVLDSTFNVAIENVIKYQQFKVILTEKEANFVKVFTFERLLELHWALSEQLLGEEFEKEVEKMRIAHESLEAIAKEVLSSTTPLKQKGGDKNETDRVT